MVQYKKELDHYQFAQRIIPYYDIIHKTVKSLIPQTNKEINALDLGVGAGGLAFQLLMDYSKLTLEGIDLSESMLKKAESRVARYQDRVKLIRGDFTKIEFTNEYDCVYSVFAIHNVSDDAKKELFSKIRDHLKSDGYFIYADIFNSSSDFLSDLYKQTWNNYMLSQGIDEEFSDSWVEDHLIKASPINVTRALKWLKEANFSEVHSIWKYYGFAVLYARK